MATEKVINVTAKTEDAVKEVEKLNKKTEETGKQAKEASKDFSGIGNTIDKVTGGAVSGFKSMLGGVKGLTGGFKGLRGAIVATGIGALVVLLASAFEFFKNTEAGAKLLDTALNALGAIVGQLGKAFQALINFDFAGVKEAFADMGTEIKGAVDATNDLFDAQEQLFELQEKQIVQNQTLKNEQRELRQAIRDTTRSDEERLKAVERLNEVNQELLNNERDELELKRQIAEANKKNAGSEEEEREIRLELQQITANELRLQGELSVIEDRAEQRRRQILESTKQDEEKLQEDRKKRREEIRQLDQELAKATEQARIKNLKDERERIEAEFQLEVAGIRKKYGEGTELEAELLIEKNRKLQEINDKNAEEKNQKELQKNKERQSLLEKFRIENQEEQLAREEQEALAEIQRLEGTEEEKARVIEFYANKRREIEQNNVQEQIRQQEFLKQQTIAMSAQTLGAVSQLLGEQSKSGKAFAIAQALINTYQGITAAVASAPFPLNVPAIAAATTTGFGAVKNIVSTNVDNPSASGGGVSRPSSGGASAQPQVQAPEFNIVGDSGTNQIAEVLGQQAKKPQKAFVVSKEVSSQQELDRNIETSASLG